MKEKQATQNSEISSRTNSPESPGAGQPHSALGRLRDRFKKLLKKNPDVKSFFKKDFGQFADNLRKQAPEMSKNFRATLSQRLSKEGLRKTLQEFDPQSFFDSATNFLQKSNPGQYGILLTLILSTYFLADLSALLLEGFIPEPPSSSMTAAFSGRDNSRRKSASDYSGITARNLFNSKGLIPGEGQAEDGAVAPDLNAPAVKSSLPLNLIGTVIMEDPMRSIATIEDKSNSLTYPVRPEDQIPDRITILQIEPRKVTFLNKANGRREYIEIPDDTRPIGPKVALGRSGGAGNIERVSATQFNVNRGEVDRALADFNNILTQARAVPNFENGLPAGYKLFQIVPGSIYDKLGLQNGDVIAGLNGESINDPAKAFELLNELKRSNHLELQVKKDGKPLTYTYDIR